MLDEPLKYSADAISLPDVDAALIERHGLRIPLESWRAAGSALAGPYWRDVSLIDLPNDLRRGTMVADYDRAANDYYVRFWGEDLVVAFGIELSQKWLSQAEHNGVMNSFVTTAHEVVRDATPRFLLHEITSPRGVRRQFPVLRMPLFNEDGEADKIMTVENIRLCISDLDADR